MAEGFRVFLISPAQLIVYSVDTQPGKTEIYNAGNLERMDNPQISGFAEISGTATPIFGVNPIVLGYKDGSLELVYVQDNKLLLSNKSPVQARGRSVVGHSIIKIPDLENSKLGAKKLMPLDLKESPFEPVQKYIDSTRPTTEKSKSESVKECSESTGNKEVKATESKVDKEKITKAKGPSKVEIVVSTADLGSCEPHDSPQLTIRSPTPRIVANDVTQALDNMTLSQLNHTELVNRVIELETKLHELWDIVKAMNQRLYRIYPVNVPSHLKVDGELVPVIPLDEIKEKMKQGEIERFTMDPILQAYAGSHRSDNRMLLYTDTKGQQYLVRAEYDAKKNQVNPING